MSVMTNMATIAFPSYEIINNLQVESMRAASVTHKRTDKNIAIHRVACVGVVYMWFPRAFNDVSSSELGRPRQKMFHIRLDVKCKSL